MMRFNLRTGLLILGVGIVLGIGIAGFLHFLPWASVLAQERVTVAFKPEERATLASLESALVRIAESVTPAVVHIRVKKSLSSSRWFVFPPDRQGKQDKEMPPEWREFFRQFRLPLPRFEIPMPRVEGQGSGVIIRSDGYILTNDHVVSGADEVEVIFKDGRRVKGKVIRDPDGDLALVKVDLQNLPTAILGDSDRVKPGQIVFAIGSPFGLTHSITMGIVSATGRQEAIGGGDRTRFYPNLIQTDAAVNQGNSGGPLVNSQGEVIGINTAIASGFTGGNVGVSFAIPINTARSVVKQLIEKGRVERGYLGITPTDLSPEDKEFYGVEEGALVASVAEDTPAWKAGLQPGDVIVEFNGQPVKNEIDLREKIANVPPGTRVNLKVVRDKRTMNLQVTLGSRPKTAAGEPAGKAAEGVEQKIGATISPLDDETRREMGLGPTEPGVLVKAVEEDGAAAEAGLQAGDVIRSINRRPVNSPSEFRQQIEKLPSGSSVRLIVLRKSDDQRMQLLVTLKIP